VGKKIVDGSIMGKAMRNVNSALGFLVVSEQVILVYGLPTDILRCPPLSRQKKERKMKRPY